MHCSSDSRRPKALSPAPAHPSSHGCAEPEPPPTHTPGGSPRIPPPPIPPPPAPSLTQPSPSPHNPALTPPPHPPSPGSWMEWSRKGSSSSVSLQPASQRYNKRYISGRGWYNERCTERGWGGDGPMPAADTGRGWPGGRGQGAGPTLINPQTPAHPPTRPPLSVHKASPLAHGRPCSKVQGRRMQHQAPGGCGAVRSRHGVAYPPHSRPACRCHRRCHRRSFCRLLSAATQMPPSHSPHVHHPWVSSQTNARTRAETEPG